MRNWNEKTNGGYELDSHQLKLLKKNIILSFVIEAAIKSALRKTHSKLWGK